MKIAFTSSNSIVAKAIKWFTNSKWSHAMLILDDTIDGDSIVVEASPKHGIQLSLLSKSSNHPIEVFQDVQDIWDINPIKASIGHNYGYLQILGFVLARAFSLKHNPFGKNEVCSELVLEWLLHTPYINEFKHLDPNLVSPQDLYEIISKSDSFKRL